MKPLSVLLYMFFISLTISAQVNNSDYKVVGVDHFGRTFPSIGGYNNVKQVGIFYWPWIGQPYASGVYDATKIAAMPNGLKLLYDFKYLNDSVSPSGQAHFWGEPLWGYYNSEDEWVIRRQMKMLTTAGIDFIVFDLTNRVTYRAVYERVFKVIEEMMKQGANPPKVVFYTHSRSFATTHELYEELYKPGLFSSAWYKVGGKPMIIAYTDTGDDIAEALSRNDTAYKPVPYSGELKNFFYFKKPQWPFDPVYENGFPWIEWRYPQPLHGGIMNVTVASHPKVPMSRSITSGWINWGRGWDPETRQNKKENIDRGTFFQLQWDNALKMDPDTVFVGGWNEWIAYKQPYGDEYMLCDAASREYSRDIEPMRGGYEDAFYIQLIKNIRKFKGLADGENESVSTPMNIHGPVAQWNDVKAKYENLNIIEKGRDNFGVSKKIRYTLAAPENILKEIKVAHDNSSFYFFVSAMNPFASGANHLQLLIGKDEPSVKGWNGYEYLIEAGNVYKLDSNYNRQNTGKAEMAVHGNTVQIKIPRKCLQAQRVAQIYFKVADGIGKPSDIMEYYVSGSALPMGRLSYLYRIAPVKKLEVAHLTVEGRELLLGTDILKPRLSWKLQSTGRSIKQAAYELWVASSREKLLNNEADLWKSNKIFSDESVNVPYGGKPLSSYQRCYWRVKVWDNNGNVAISDPQLWTMGLLKPSDWQAKWIGLNGFNKSDQPDSVMTRLSARFLRKEFSAAKKVVDATAYISGLGLYELYINGKKVALDVLAPGPTEYDKRVFYNTYDISNCLKQGINCVGVILGNGRFFGMRNYHGKPDPLTGIPQKTYGLPQLLMQIRIRYADGSSSFIVTDQSWKVTDNGPILADNEYDGEEYDANKELTGWNKAGYHDGDWKNAALMPAGKELITAQPNENIVVKEILHPVAVKHTSRGSYILDMGQNMVGWLAIAVNGKRGDTVRMQFAETMKGEDAIYTANMRNAQVTDKYILKGEGKERWEPRFTYHGFRYVEIWGLHEAPAPNDFEGKVLYDDVQTIGKFKTSNETINAIFKNAYWTIRGNYRGMPTDCPQRDERVGWLGDRVMSSYGESFIFDNSRLYAKWLDDIDDSQKSNGSLPNIAPTYWDCYADNVTYPSAFILIPEMLRRQFGDSSGIRKHYPAMRKWIMYMWNTYREDDLILKDIYGDWCVPPESLDLIWSKDPARITDGGLLASAYFYYCLGLMKDYASLVGERADIAGFEAIAQKIRVAFNKKFYHSESKSYSNNTITANLLPLSFNMVPGQDREAVFQNIRAKLKEFDDHVNSGIIGGMWLMRGLSDNGATDLAYKLATNTTYPSWGYMVKKGATTIWELWNGDAANPVMNSGNHQMLLGDLLIWYYEYLAGIKTDAKQTAFKKIIMHPVFPDGLNFVRASLETKYGEVKSEWHKSDQRLDWTITIPPNASAEITFPTAEINKIKEGDKQLPAELLKGKTTASDGKIRLNTGSGTYHFTVQR